MNNKQIHKMKKIIRKELRVEISDMISHLSRENLLRRLYTVFCIIIKKVPGRPYRPYGHTTNKAQ